MYASGKPVWYLPFVFLVVSFLLLSSIRFWFSENILRSSARYPDTLTSIFTSETLDALNQDPRLQDALLSLSEAIAQSSTDLGERFRFKSLKSFGTNLTDGVTQIRALQQTELKRRGLLEDMSQAFGNLIGGGAGGLNLTGGLSGILSGLGGSVVDSLSTPALFLGIGLGMGATTGLNLTDMQDANAQASKVASAYNASATGINLVAQNLGSGLAGQIAPSFSNSNISLGPAAFALASGIGNATAMGLKLTPEKFLPTNDSSIEGIAGNFGLGIAMPIVSKIDLQALMKNVGGDGTTSTLMQQLPQIAAAAGMGLGEGAKNGLGLVAPNPAPANLLKRQQANDPLAGVNIPETVGLFTKGLSQSFIQGSDLSKLNLTGGMNLTSTFDLQTMLRPLAAGAGAGIGMGVAIGLNLKSADAMPMFGNNITGDDQQTALVAEGFVQNLLSNLLMNSTVLQMAQQFIANNPPQLFKDVNTAKAAEGFARGTIEGVMSAMSSVGGLKNLISGDVPPDALQNVPVLSPTKFDDSLNGSAVGFARGLTGDATILVAEVIRNLTRNAQNSTAATPARRRSLDSGADEVGVVPFNALSARQATESGTTQVPLAVDAPTVQMGAQKAIDFLTCQGIGGVASVGLGLMNSGKAKANLMDMAQGGVPLDPRVTQGLPDGPITLTSEGNNFQIVLKDASIEINGMKIIPFAVVTVLHVVFAGLAFLTFLPLYLILGVVWRFSVLAGYPVNETKNRKWRLGFLITFAILGIVGIILGIAGMGNARHFRDAHGVVGLLVFIFIFPAVGFSIIRLRTTLPHPSPATFAGIKAPIALAKTPQRIYLISGILTQLVLALGQFAFLQGFSTLRAISLCIIDAILTSPAVAGLMSFVLMVQISATALVGIRAWLEQHIAKREAAGVEKTTMIETAEKSRKSSIQTFGFDRKDPPPRLNLSLTRKSISQRKTEDLKGFEDVAISSPFNVRKEGSISSPREDPFLSPDEQQNREQTRTYNPKTGGYQYDNEENDNFYTFTVGLKSTPKTNATTPSQSSNYLSGRPSSDVFDPMRSPQPPIATGPKKEGVTTADLFPPMPQSQLTSRSIGSSYSRPFDGKTPNRDTFMGFGESGKR